MGCYIPEAISDGRIGPYERAYRQGRGGEARDRLRAAVRGCWPPPSSPPRSWRAPRSTPWGCVSGGRDRHRDRQAGGHARRLRQRLRGGGQAAAVRARRHRSFRRPDRDHGDLRRHGGRRTGRRRLARPGRARTDFARGLHHQQQEDCRRAARGHRESARTSRYRADRQCRVARLWRAHSVRQRRGDGAGVGPHQLGAYPGHDEGSGLVSRPPDQLWRAVPRRAHLRLLRRQGHRHQPHLADQGGGPLYGRPVGREIHQDPHLPAHPRRRGVGADRRVLLAPVRAGAFLRPQGASRHSRATAEKPGGAG